MSREKFAELDRMLAEAKTQKIDVVVVHSPVVLGDDYAELTENLSRIAESGLLLKICKRRGDAE